MGWLDKHKMPDGGILKKGSTQKQIIKNSSLPQENKELLNEALDVKDFYSNYLNSPIYIERLKKQGWENPENIIKLRENRLNHMKIGLGVTTQYSPNTNIVEYNFNQNQLLGVPKSSSVAHEVSHGLGSQMKDQGYFRLNENEIKELSNRNIYNNKSISPNDIDYSKPTSHDNLPSEIKADIDALRYNLYKDGIYDTSKGDINEDQLKKASEKYKDDLLYKRLSNQYKPSDLIYLMNNIAMNESSNDETLIAKNGIKMPDGGKIKKPIFTENSNDPRLKSYKDSLSMYEASQKLLADMQPYLGDKGMTDEELTKQVNGILAKSIYPKDINEFGNRAYVSHDYSKDKIKPIKTLPLYYKTKDNADIEKIKDERLTTNINERTPGITKNPVYELPIYKQPVQPIVFKKNHTPPQLNTAGLENNYQPQIQPLNVSPNIQPISRNNGGEPVYAIGGANAPLLGFYSNGEFEASTDNPDAAQYTDNPEYMQNLIKRNYGKDYKPKYVDGGLLNSTNTIDYSVWRSQGIEDGQWLNQQEEITDQSPSESNITEPQQYEETAEDSQTGYSYASQVTPLNYEKIYSIDNTNSFDQPSTFSSSRQKANLTGNIAPAKLDTTGKAVYDGLINRGLNSLAAAAITGNAAGESNFNLRADNPTSHAQGIIQWLGKRKRDFNAFAKQTGRKVDDLEVQLDFIIKELGSTHKYVADALAKARTPQEATKIVLDKYEAPSLADRKKSYPKRLSHTLAYYKSTNGATMDSTNHWIQNYL